MKNPHSNNQNAKNVGSAERLLSDVAGGSLIAYGLTYINRSPARALLTAVVGGLLLKRGVTGKCDVYTAMGVSTAHPDARFGSSHLRHSTLIKSPSERLYAHWRKLSNLPRFMNHLETVEVINDNLSHWIARGPLGIEVSWNAEISSDIPGKSISWKSTSDSDLKNEGIVQFMPTGRDETLVVLDIRYEPPAGPVGEALVRLTGPNPDTHVKNILRRFKQLIETGELATVQGQPNGARPLVSSTSYIEERATV